MIKVNKLKEFAGKDFLIKEVYNKYHSGWTDNGTTRKNRIYKFFPKSTEQILVNGTSEMEEVKKLSMDNNTELREQIWNKELRQYEFHRQNEKLTADFFKTYKKVFDVVIEFKDEQEVMVWSSAEGREVKEKAKEVQVVAVPASRIKAMIEVLVDEEVPTEERKDRTGVLAILPVYDYEDIFKDKLKGKFCKFKVSGAGLDTKYTFLPGKEFSIEAPKTEIDISDVPF